MTEQGLAETPGTGSIPAPKTMRKPMFKNVEQGDNIARGHVELIELIAYDAVGKKIGEDGKVMTDQKGMEILVEKSRGPYFCQDREDVIYFTLKNPAARIESFTIQVLKSTAINYLNNSENMKQFERKEDK